MGCFDMQPWQLSHGLLYILPNLKQQRLGQSRGVFFLLVEQFQMEAGCCGLTLLTGRQITLWFLILLMGNARELHPTGAVPHKRPLLFLRKCCSCRSKWPPFPSDWVWTRIAFQALSFYSNERLASQPLQTDRVSQKIPNASAFGIFSFHFSLFVLYLHSPCVQPLHQNDCKNPAVHIQAAAMAAEKVSPVEKRRTSLLEYSLS